MRDCMPAPQKSGEAVERNSRLLFCEVSAIFPVEGSLRVPLLSILPSSPYPRRCIVSASLPARRACNPFNLTSAATSQYAMTQALYRVSALLHPCMCDWEKGSPSANILQRTLRPLESAPLTRAPEMAGTDKGSGFPDNVH